MSSKGVQLQPLVEHDALNLSRMEESGEIAKPKGRCSGKCKKVASAVASLALVVFGMGTFGAGFFGATLFLGRPSQWLLRYGVALGSAVAGGGCLNIYLRKVCVR